MKEIDKTILSLILGLIGILIFIFLVYKGLI